jgi:hypothetical protein
VARWKGATLPGWTIASNGDLDPIRQCLRNEVRTKKIEPQVRHRVGVRAFRRLHEIASNHIEADGSPTLNPRIPEVLARLEEVAESVGVLEFFVESSSKGYAMAAAPAPIPRITHVDFRFGNAAKSLIVL